MKIEYQDYSSSTSRSGRAGEAAGVHSTQSKVPGLNIPDDHGDKAEVSGVAQVIQSSQADRSSQVDRLGGLVRSGQYNVDPAAISRSIVTEAIAAAGSQ